jgi:Fe-S oxidoreductase
MRADYFTPHAKLSVIVVISFRAANYIKLVSEGHIPFRSDSQEYVISDDQRGCYDFWVSGTPPIREVASARRCQRLWEGAPDMEVALMIPCYIDVFYPQVGIATLELLERLGVDVTYPKEQTCCGQPMANSGCYEEARATEEHCASAFGSFEYVVTPSDSCVHHIRNKFSAGADSPEKENLTRNTYDLVEFLHDVLKVRDFPWATFERKVAFHTSCSAIRGLNMA